MRKLLLIILLLLFVYCHKKDNPIRPQPMWTFKLSECRVNWKLQKFGEWTTQPITGTSEGKVYVYTEYVEVEGSYSYETPEEETISENIIGQVNLPAQPGVVEFLGDAIKILVREYELPAEMGGPLQVYIVGDKI